MNAAYMRVMFSGHVQGVGFRYQTRELATAYEVTGYVRNTSDGRVELEIEGRKEELDAFIKELESRMSGFIKNKTVSEGAREAIHKGFAIAR